jgi:putative transposase
MEQECYNGQYRISSARATWHGYDGGMYFVTICTAGHVHYFGEIVARRLDESEMSGTVFSGNNDVLSRDGVHTVSETTLRQTSRVHNLMVLNDTGCIARDNFLNVSSHYPDVCIPQFVIMPNHIHLLVDINGEYHLHEGRGDGVHTVSTEHTGEGYKGPEINTKMQQIAQKKGRLSVVIGGLKRAIKHEANLHRLPLIWQTRFYDRIIRSQEELNGISQYMANNVERWHLDSLYE